MFGLGKGECRGGRKRNDGREGKIYQAATRWNFALWMVILLTILMSKCIKLQPEAAMSRGRVLNEYII